MSLKNATYTCLKCGEKMKNRVELERHIENTGHKCYTFPASDFV